MRFFAAVSLLVAACSAAQSVPAEDWEYVTVRDRAHMFWWLVGSTNGTVAREEQPLVLWLQGGPGGSSTGFGQFLEIGTHDVSGNPRKSTWAQSANLLFVDNPVGTGFSYVDDESALTTTNAEISADLVTLLAAFMAKYPAFETAPLFIFSESYGGKMTTGFANALLRAVDAGTLKANLRGVTLGDSWISPLDFVMSWGPLLHAVSLLDDTALEAVNEAAGKVAAAVKAEQWAEATSLWGDSENVIIDQAFDVSFYNVLKHHDDSDESTTAAATSLLMKTASPRTADALAQQPALHSLLRRHLARLHAPSLSALMNGPIRKKLGVIPANVTWGGQAGDVFSALSADFMRPVVSGNDSVASLLADGRIHVNVEEGQLDLICATTGAEAWLRQLELKDFQAAQREQMLPLTPAGQPDYDNAVYRKRAPGSKLTMYFVNKAGHMVPADNPTGALLLLQDIIFGQ